MIPLRGTRPFVYDHRVVISDRDMLAHYMTLALADRKTVCDGVAALTVVATVKLEIYKKQAPSPRGISTASYK